MICKKCGANIEDTSKFCGYCGGQVEKTDKQQEVTNTSLQEQNYMELEKTVQVEPINPSSISEFNENSNQIVDNPGVQVNQSSNENSAVPKAKSNKLLFIIGGIVLGVVAIVLVVLAFTISSNKDILVLEKAINNLATKGENSATVDTNITLKTSDGQELSFMLTAKTEKQNNGNMDMLLTLNENQFVEEMNVYASLLEDKITMYMESSLIDMLGMTSSVDSTWIYYTMPLEELTNEYNAKETNIEFELKDLLDNKHFMFVEKTGELNHYVLVIDQEMVDKLKEKISELGEEELNETLDSIEKLEKEIKIDFYITKSNDLERIELNMTEHLTDVENISSFVISMSFRDLNTTDVKIPNEAKDSIIDLQTYFMSNPVLNGFDDQYEISDENYYYDNTVDVQL